MQGDQKAGLVTDRALPRIRDGYVRVQVKAVALNPTDWKHIEDMNTPGCLCGCDFAGVVEDEGSADSYSKRWRRGDRICGAVHGGNKLVADDGAFAEHIGAKADVSFRIPDDMSFEEASTLGVGLLTVGQGLFQTLGLDFPDSKHNDDDDKPRPGRGEPVLIYGGSTATGTLGIQLAKLAGYTPITTCRAHNFDLVKSVGAAAAFDYRDADQCVREIKEYLRRRSGDDKKDTVDKIWDCVSVPSSAAICAQVITPESGQYASLLPVAPFTLPLPGRESTGATTTTITPVRTLMYTVFNEPVAFRGLTIDPKPADFEFARDFVALCDDLLRQGKIKVHPPKVVGTGLERVLDGLDMLKHGTVSGEKLVCVV